MESYHRDGKLKKNSRTIKHNDYITLNDVSRTIKYNGCITLDDVSRTIKHNGCITLDDVSITIKHNGCITLDDVSRTIEHNDSITLDDVSRTIKYNGSGHICCCCCCVFAPVKGRGFLNCEIPLHWLVLWLTTHPLTAYASPWNWRALVNTVMNFRLPQKVGISWLY